MFEKDKKMSSLFKYTIILLTAALGYYARAAILELQISDVSSSNGNELTKTYQYNAYLFFTTVNGVSTKGKEKNRNRTTTLEKVKSELAKGTEGDITKYAAYAQNNNSYNNGSTSFSLKGTEHEWNKDASVSAFAVIVDAYYYKDADYYMIAKLNGNEVISSVYNSTANTLSLDFGSQAGNEWVEIVPEPSSGLLLVLGIATLALRRERGTYTVPNSL